MRLFVTGGAGFIGSAFCRYAVSNGHEVLVYDQATDKNHVMSNYLMLAESIDSFSPDWIIHLAATPGVSSSMDVGIEDICGMRNLLKASGRVNNVLFVSTGSIYGQQRILKTREDAATIEQQVSYYANAKLACEGLLSVWCAQNKKNGVILRLGTIIGPGNNKGFIRDFVRKLSENPDLLSVMGDGKQTKSYLHVEDLVTAMFATMSGGGEAAVEYNVSHYYAPSIRECIPWVCDEIGVKPEVEYGNANFFGDIKDIYLDNKKLCRNGWYPKYTVEDAVRANVRWLLNQKEKAA